MGTSIRTLADYLGHKDPSFTLRIYTHLMPAAADKTRGAFDRAFDALEDSVDGPSGGPDVAPAAT